MDINQIRKDTPGTTNLVHLNNAGASLCPVQVTSAIRDYISEEEFTGGYELADKKREELDTFYDYAAQLLHCKKNNIAFTTNATDSYNRALSAVPFKQGDVVLLTENDYPSNFIAFLSLQKRLGIEIIQVKNTESGEIDLEDLENKMLLHKPRLVSVSHVPTSSGLVQPVEAIGKIVKKYDTLYLLDACQSLGQIDVDGPATGADFISGTFRKFLRGPRGAGLLYVSDTALAAGLEPLFIDLQGAEWQEENEYIARADAKRFEDWETSYALMMGSKEALKYLLNIGIEAIMERNALLFSRLVNALAEISFVTLQDRGKQRCNIVTFSLTGHTPEKTKNHFSRSGINIYIMTKVSAVIDFAEKDIEWVVRVSPHYYNTENEIDRFIEILKTL
ncbi:aminotransferase class V-fold PLP-dependent enzyme [Pedobacter sp.]|jgi:selenocysteine lyase/cysteine desulfurase|uniref:aminotransferase class V-fold PLP-dependent enzyme n=1 Tax=Pedobacter sp. TaxID=1411316 RepID=UPI002B574C01|nr:aminotransferase class V-fold PLP-dependent enzyme [Pedobacter sp.]HWW38720.1 aminotransferase class V-fold PLP-dependent enzyme [Pedobacter sp.]